MVSGWSDFFDVTLHVILDKIENLCNISPVNENQIIPLIISSTRPPRFGAKREER